MRKIIAKNSEFLAIMKIHCAHTETADIESLTPHPMNPNRHPQKQIDLLAKILKHQGWRNPIVISKRSGFVIKGHARLQAAKLNAWITVPVDKQDYATEADEYADMVADNKIAELAESDEQMIQKLAAEMSPDFDFDLFGIPDFEIPGLTSELGTSDKSNEDQNPNVSKQEQEEQRLARIQIPQIKEGDCLEVLKTLDSESVDSLVTDPPAGIAFMGKDWDKDKGGRDQWVSWLTDVMKQCMRVLKPGAHGLVWAIPRTSHWTATACEDAGFEVRDVVTHIFGSGFPKSLDISKAIDKAVGAEREVIGTMKAKLPTSNNKFATDAWSIKAGKMREIDITAPTTPDAKRWQGWGTSLKPASEHWILVRKPCSEKTVAQNVLKHGTGGINIDSSRIPANSEAWEPEKNLCDTCVNLAGKNAKHSTQVTKGSTARENADTKDLEKTHGKPLADISSEDIGCSEEMLVGNTNSNLSMSMSGKNIQARKSKKDSSSITSMEIDRITESKTCNMCEQPLTSSTTRMTKQGRFPSNLVLSHNPDCVQVGTKKVKGITGGTKPHKSEAPITQHGGFKESKNRPYFNHTSPDGTETVAAWECTEGCAVAMLDEQSGTSKSSGGRTVKRSGKYEEGKVSAPGQWTNEDPGFGDIGGASRFFYCAKASKADKNIGLTDQNNHPTVKSIKLMTYFVKMVTPPGGLVLDCFCGSGSTGVAAGRHGFKFIGIEKDPHYVQIASHRFAHELKISEEELLENEEEEEIEEEPELVEDVNG